MSNFILLRVIDFHAHVYIQYFAVVAEKDYFNKYPWLVFTSIVHFYITIVSYFLPRMLVVMIRNYSYRLFKQLGMFII